jgi:hypothetical protein
MRSKRQRWPRIWINALVELREQQLSSREICTRLQCRFGREFTPAMIEWQAWRLRLPSLARKSPLKGHEAAIAEMSRAGIGPTRIAERFGVSLAVANAFMCYYGLYHRGRRREPVKPVSMRPISLPPISLPSLDSFHPVEICAGSQLRHAMEDA